MTNDVSQQAQIISPVVDPFTNGYTIARMVSIAVLIVGGSFSAIFSFGMYPNPIWILSTLMFCTIVISYTLFARDEQTLHYNLDKLGFHKRKLSGREGMSKYDEKTTEKQVKSYISWEEINEETGLRRHNYDNAREYLGNYCFSLIAIPPAEVDKDTLNESFRRAFRAIPFKCSQKIIVMTGIDPKFILDDIERLLEQPGLSTMRELELESMKQTFSESNGAVDRTYLLDITLAYTLQEEKAQIQMNKIMNGYIRLLNKKKVRTVLITETDDMILLYQSMLTGKKLYGVV
jgi:hypothetical protein